MSESRGYTKIALEVAMEFFVIVVNVRSGGLMLTWVMCKAQTVQCLRVKT